MADPNGSAPGNGSSLPVRHRNLAKRYIAPLDPRDPETKNAPRRRINLGNRYSEKYPRTRTMASLEIYQSPTSPRYNTRKASRPGKSIRKISVQHIWTDTKELGP